MFEVYIPEGHLSPCIDVTCGPQCLYNEPCLVRLIFLFLPVAVLLIYVFYCCAFFLSPPHAVAVKEPYRETSMGVKLNIAYQM